MRSQKGITLVALVVTIIVLLILAGVTIALVMGQDGIFNKANTASEETFYGDVDSIVKLAVLTAQVDSYDNEGTRPAAPTDADLTAAAEAEVKAAGYSVEDYTATTGTSFKAVRGSLKAKVVIADGKATVTPAE